MEPTRQILDGLNHGKKNNSSIEYVCPFLPWLLVPKTTSLPSLLSQCHPLESLWSSSQRSFRESKTLPAMVWPISLKPHKCRRKHGVRTRLKRRNARKHNWKNRKAKECKQPKGMVINTLTSCAFARSPPPFCCATSSTSLT